MWESESLQGGENESICQLAWGPDDLLYFISDRTGWWNLYREKEGIIEPLCPLEAEFGSPQWLLGQTSFGFWGTDQLICKVSQNGVDFLAQLSLEERELKRIDLPFTSYKNLSITGDPFTL